MRKMLTSLLTTLAVAYVGFAALLFLFQDKLAYYPQIGREIHSTPRQHGMDYETLALDTADGERLDAWFVPAPQARGVVLFLHGNAGNLSHRMDSIAMFHRLGYGVLIFDYRGYGRSSGKPSRLQGLQDRGADEAQDGAGIGVVGAKLGGLVGVQPTFEQGAEDGRLYGGPVQLRQAAQALDILASQGQGIGVSKRPPLKRSMGSAPNRPPLAMGPKRSASILGSRSGRLFPASLKAHLSKRRLEALRRSSRVRTWTSGTMPVKAVRTTMRWMSLTMSSGGYSRAGV